MLAAPFIIHQLDFLSNVGISVQNSSYLHSCFIDENKTWPFAALKRHAYASCRRKVVGPRELLDRAQHNISRASALLSLQKTRSLISSNGKTKTRMRKETLPGVGNSTSSIVRVPVCQYGCVPVCTPSLVTLTCKES